MTKIISLALSLVFLCTTSALADDLIKIGVLTDLSGNASYYGNQTRVGAILAERELQAQGKNVRVVFEDSALSTAKGLAAAQKLITVDKVDALFVDFSSIAVAVSSILEGHDKVMVYGAAAESVARKNAYAFKTYSDYALGCEALVKEFLKKGVKKIGVLKAETEYGDLCLAGAKRVATIT